MGRNFSYLVYLILQYCKGRDPDSSWKDGPYSAYHVPTTYFIGPQPFSIDFDGEIEDQEAYNGFSVHHADAQVLRVNRDEDGGAYVFGDGLADDVSLRIEPDEAKDLLWDELRPLLEKTIVLNELADI